MRVGTMGNSNLPYSDNDTPLSEIRGVIEGQRAYLSKVGGTRSKVAIYSQTSFMYTAGSNVYVVDCGSVVKAFEEEEILNAKIIKMVRRGGYKLELTIPEEGGSSPVKCELMGSTNNYYLSSDTKEVPLTEICGTIEKRSSYASTSREGGMRSKVTVYSKDRFTYTAGSDINLVDSSGTVLETFEEDILVAEVIKMTRRGGFKFVLISRMEDLDEES